MKVKVQFYDDKPLSASVPKRVTRKVKEEIAATPRYMALSIVTFRNILDLYHLISCCYFFLYFFVCLGTFSDENYLLIGSNIFPISVGLYFP